MKKQIVLFVGALALLAAPAFADDEKMGVTYENTINVKATDAEGNAVEINTLYEADGTYTTDADGSGAWEVVGEQLCTTPTDGEQGCVDVDWGHAVGDTWEATGADGAVSTITIVEGRS
jgi:hypothetical protein